MEELAKQLGYNTAPFIYAGMAYGLFHWLDENASDEAKAALARTMRFKDYMNEQVASALVEVFDRIYTYPLLRWRAFCRSLLFTTVVSAIFLFEVLRPAVMRINQDIGTNWALWLVIFLALLLFNAFSDYLSLFVIRPLLVRSGTKPVIGLALGAMSGTAIVIASNALRIALVSGHGVFVVSLIEFVQFVMPWGPDVLLRLIYAWPALAVFVWLPLFALGILIVRLLTPLS